MRSYILRPSLAAALAVLLLSASARAGLVDWTYTWNRSAFAVPANGGTRQGAVNLILPGGPLSPPIAPVSLRAFTALANGADRYDDAAYALTLALRDPHSSQSHTLTVHGELDGTVTSDRVSLHNLFTGGSGVQTFDFLGHDFTVTFGFTAVDASPRAWAGKITASVQEDAAPSVEMMSAEVTPAALPTPSAAPEPAGLVLAALALPSLGLLARCLRRRASTCGS